MHYAVDPDGGLVQVPLDSLTALYHRAAGQTHIVAAPVPEILALLADGPLTAEAILAALGLDADADTLALVRARLDELVEAGLVVTR